MSTAYGIVEHGMMLADRVRLHAYLATIRRVVRPGSVVVDVGSGTGVFAVAAALAGARRVYAIEAGEVIAVAREVATANGCADRIVFLQRFSGEVTLDEPADVLMLDVRSVMPDEQIPVVADARRRLLKPGGIVIPAVDELWAAPVSAPDLYAQHVGCWDQPDGVDLRPSRDAAVSRRYKCRVAARQLVGEPKRWAAVDYGANDDVSVRGAASWTIETSCVAHGMVAWFECRLDAATRLSNRPGDPPLLYGQVYAPWREPVSLQAGQRLDVGFSGSGDAALYTWSIVCTVVPAHACDTAGGINAEPAP